MKRLKQISIVLFGLIAIAAGYFAYDFYLFDYINNRQLENHKRQLVNHFDANPTLFNKVTEKAKLLPNIQSLYFSKNHRIDMIINHCPPPTNSNDWCLNVEINDTASYDLDFINEDTLKIFIYDTLLITTNWTIYFDSDKDHKNFPELLKHLKVEQQEILQWNDILQEMNCFGIIKTDSIIQFQYAGHIGVSLDYVIPIKENYSSPKYTKLNDDYLFGVSENFIWCGRMDW